jgi:hypothetical protein
MSLGYVRRELYDGLRARAEERAREWCERINFVEEVNRQLNIANGALVEAMKQQRESSERLVKDLLAHLKPLPPATLSNPNSPIFQDMTAEEIMAIPASSKREMGIRTARAAQARVKEAERKDNAQMQRIRELQTPEEQAATTVEFDPMLGMFEEAKDASP